MSVVQDNFQAGLHRRRLNEPYKQDKKLNGFFEIFQEKPNV
jgi:hypothetical protein